jgi:ParB/RepB/Spo0J family partition protein
MEDDSATVTAAHTLQGLANSIREVGILQPIRVRVLVPFDDAGEPVPAAGDGAARYQIVSGQRRYEAAKMLGLSTVPCLLIDAPQNASHTLVSQVTENLQRKAMTASELALAVQSLVQAGDTQEVVANKLGIQPSQVTLLLNLLTLTGPAKVAFERGLVESPRAAYDLNKLPPALQIQLVNEAERKGRIVTQRDVREVKQLHSRRLAQERHRYEVPAVSADEYSDFVQCLHDGVQDDHYDPSDDRFAVFGGEWPALEARQTGVPWAGRGTGGAAGGGSSTGPQSDADTVDALRVRVPGFSLTLNQVERLFALLQQPAPEPQTIQGGPALVGRDLARWLSEI